VSTELEDLTGLFDLVERRFAERMRGLTDDEWSWRPTPDERIGLRWRLAHLADVLVEPRHRAWLGLPAGAAVTAAAADPIAAPSAVEALARVERGYRHWRELLAHPDLDLSAAVGPAAGRFRDASRRSYVLHVADELVHHTAEACLLRDLYGRMLPPEPTPRA
jgi:hypothetical protein